MQIVGKDYVIKKDKYNYVLYIKTKNGKPKLGGYFTTIYNALNRVYRWRIDKKYPHKEKASEITEYLKEFDSAEETLKKMSNSIKRINNKIDEDINGIRGVQNRNKTKA